LYTIQFCLFFPLCFFWITNFDTPFICLIRGDFDKRLRIVYKFSFVGKLFRFWFGFLFFRLLFLWQNVIDYFFNSFLNGFHFVVMFFLRETIFTKIIIWADCALIPNSFNWANFTLITDDILVDLLRFLLQVLFFIFLYYFVVVIVVFKFHKISLLLLLLSLLFLLTII